LNRCIFRSGARGSDLGATLRQLAQQLEATGIVLRDPRFERGDTVGSAPPAVVERTQGAPGLGVARAGCDSRVELIKVNETQLPAVMFLERPVFGDLEVKRRETSCGYSGYRILRAW
jgi:hypothetical protein